MGKIQNSTMIIVLAAVAVFGFIAWSLLAEIDQIARAPGSVIPSGRNQIIQSLDGGIVNEMHVQAGDRVKKGQLLVTLDDVTQAAGVDEGRGKVASLKSQMVRIKAELFNRPLVFPADVQQFPEFVANQRGLYAQRREAMNSDQANLKQMLVLVKDELEMNLPLVKSGDVSRSEVLRMQRTVQDLQGQITNKKNAYLQELQTEYAKIEEELATAEQAYRQRSAALTRTKLYAPSDGVVVNVRFTTLGAVIKPGDEVMQISPSGEELVVEARVTPADIAYVRLGQDASVKFDAYDSGIYGSANGKVTYISADTLSEQTEKGQISYYRVHLSADTRPMHPRLPGEKIEIQPGMTATAEIKTGRSTVFRYLFKPVLKTFGQSLGER